MRITETKLRRMLRKVITEMRTFPDPELEQDFPEYGSGSEFNDEVVLRIDEADWPDFDRLEFEDYCYEVSQCHISNDKDMNGAPNGLIRITGPFDALWNGWVNLCGDDPHEFMNYVIRGEENCPELP